METKFKYRVDCLDASGQVFSLRWDGEVAPTFDALCEFINEFNFSLLPDGANAHIGLDAEVFAARIVDTRTGEIVQKISRAGFDAAPDCQCPECQEARGRARPRLEDYQPLEGDMVH